MGKFLIGMLKVALKPPDKPINAAGVKAPAVRCQKRLITEAAEAMGWEGLRNAVDGMDQALNPVGYR